METIIIGRQGSQRSPISDPTVSKQHASLTPNGDGTYTLQHLSHSSPTYVNGLQVLTSTVTDNDVIKMGNYEIKVADLIPLPDNGPVNPPNPPQPPQPPQAEVDLAHLKAIWEKYDADVTAIQTIQRKIGLLRSIVPIFTMGGAAFTAVAHSMEWPSSILIVSTILTIVGVVISAYTFYKGYTFDAFTETKKVTQQFQEKYVCPNCGAFLGNAPYNILRTTRKTCLLCRVKFKYSQ